MEEIKETTPTEDWKLHGMTDIIMSKEPGYNFSFDIARQAPFYTEATSESICETFGGLTSMHYMFADTHQDEMFIKLAAHSLVVEAYVRGLIRMCRYEKPGDNLNGDPSMELYWSILRRMVRDLINAGYVLDDNWISAINPFVSYKHPDKPMEEDRDKRFTRCMTRLRENAVVVTRDNIHEMSRRVEEFMVTSGRLFEETLEVTDDYSSPCIPTDNGYVRFCATGNELLKDGITDPDYEEDDKENVYTTWKYRHNVIVGATVSYGGIDKKCPKISFKIGDRIMFSWKLGMVYVENDTVPCHWSGETIKEYGKALVREES